MQFNWVIITLAIVSTGFAIATIVLSVSLSNSYKDNTGELSTEASTVPSTMTPGSTTKEPTEPWEKEYRLPKDTEPLHYEIFLHPDLQTGSFKGTVDIHLNVTASRNFLLVHIKYLNITSTVLRKGLGANGEQISGVQGFEYAPNEFWVVQLASAISAGEYTLSLAFDGSLTKDIVGFYKSNYYNIDTNTTRTIATSKFEPTYARRAFPCMDEPSFKSTFGVKLVRPSDDGYVAFSNMPQINEVPNSPSAGLTTVTFNNSVKMVTYLACFIVCDFQTRLDYTSGDNGNPRIPIRTISRPNQFNNTVYPLKVGVGVTEFYEKYFDIPYALPKQDLIAIPDFVSGAMEHWGLVTFRETALLFSDRESSTANQKRVATVVAHELAHQWFGNLMTIDWWEDLWLNEGFASYMEYKGTDAVEPSWDIFSQILTDDVGPVLKLDAKLSSHPIIQTVNHPDEITELFDTISYSKGSSVLMMLENFMGPVNFQKGIQNFLKKYAFANAATPDLWHELELVTPELNISRIMDTWTRQMGYPVLSYTTNGSQIKVRQTRFLSDPNKKSSAKETPSPYGYKWDVPIFYITDKSSTPIAKWLYMEDDTVTIDLPAGVTWFKLNADQQSFFRVNYDSQHWKALALALQNNLDALNPKDRWGVIDDSFSLSEAALLPYGTPLDLVQYVKNDRHPVPWSAASEKLSSISSLVYATDTYAGFRKMVITLVKGPFAELGWNDSGEFLDKSLRSTILSLSCESDYAPCLSGAADRFRTWIDTKDYIPPNFRSLVYRFGIAQIGDGEIWNEMWQRFTVEQDPNEAIKLLYGLAFPKEPWLIYQYLELAKTSAVRSQDYFTVLGYISQNPTGLPIVWDFIRNQWEYLVDRFSTNNRNLGNMVNTVCSKFTTQQRLDEMNEFFTKYPDAGAGARARQQALETVQNNINWLKTNKPLVDTWLKQNGYMP